MTLQTKTQKTIMKIAMMFLSLILTISMYGQADFSGTWKLNNEKSKYGRVDPSNAAATKLVVEQKKGTITLWRNEYPKQSLKIDSTAEIEVAGSNGNKARVSMKPTPDKDGLIETRTYIYAEGQSGIEAKKTRTWTLSGDKKILIIEEYIILTDGQTVDMTLIYDRQ
jgi:hypothetical protein